MNIIVFACPGVIGPYVFCSLALRAKEQVRYLVLPLSDRHNNDELITVARLAQIPCLAPKHLNDAAFLEQIRAAEPDVLIVSSYDTKLPTDLITMPRLAAVNLHPSLLPKYRGACPEFWAIRNGDEETGVTLHTLTETFDAGDIIAQEKFAIGPQETLGSLLHKASRSCQTLIFNFLDALHAGELIERKPQDHFVATAAPLVNTQSIAINWQETSHSVCCLIRAGNPVGGAWTTLRGHKLVIWYAVACKKDDAYMAASMPHKPGTVIVDSIHKRFLVRTGDGLVEISCLQYAHFCIIDGWHFVEQAYASSHELLGKDMFSSD
jgi:methionyl-tRNA formyltransferase